MQVWRSGFRARPARFAMVPEPRSIGVARVGQDIAEGRIILAHTRLNLGGGTLWSPRLKDPEAEAARQGFGWLDDLAAFGSRQAGECARDWLCAWLDHTPTAGIAWRPDIAGRRLVRFVHHAASLQDRLDPRMQAAFLRSLTRHLRYLAATWRQAAPGLPRFEALTGLIIGGLPLVGGEQQVRAGIKALETLCRTDIGADGGLPSRNPESLLDLCAMLVWAEMAMTDAGLVAQPEHRAAITRIAPVLRALRHMDGGLARFHGGGRGPEGRLDSVLAAARVRGRAGDAPVMGYARLMRGRSSVILDAAAPPLASPLAAHASTLAFEMTVGPRPLIVNCGDGSSFGAEWAKAARATPAHSTLAPHGVSSSGFTDGRDGYRLTDPPGDVRCDPKPERGPASLIAAHDGFAESHGLVHLRRMDLSADGTKLSGEDLLSAATDATRQRLGLLLHQRGGQGVGFSVRFHLHPDVTARAAPDGLTVELMLKSGELWLFRHASKARISLDPSVYLEKTRAQPVPTRQIVLEAAAVDHSTVIRWSLSRSRREATQPQGATPARA